MRTRKTIPCLGLMLVLWPAPARPAGSAVADFAAGTPLPRALEVLREAGLPIVFTSRFVHGGMKVSTTVPAGEPRRTLTALLEPHGLQAVERPSGVLVVVARPASTPIASLKPPEESRSFVVREEIFVRPSRLALLHETTDSTFALDRSEIDALPHLGGDVFRATSLLPGITANDVTAQFSVRGGRRDEVRIVLDGLELYEAYHLKDHDSALSVVSADLLGSATLVTGALPASHGDRMSGVLDLRTTAVAEERRFRIGLSALDLTGAWSGRSDAGSRSWLLSARRGSLDLAGRAIGQQSPEFWDAFGRLETALGGGLLSGRFLLTDDGLEVSDSEGEDFERFDNRYRAASGWLTHQTPTPGDGFLETLASWSAIQRRRGGSASEEKGEFSLDDRRESSILGASQSLSLPAAAPFGGGLGLGWEARRFVAAFDYDKQLDPDFLILGANLLRPPSNHRLVTEIESRHLGAWASGRLSPLDRLTLELGVRVDRHSETGETTVSPRFSSAWSLGDRSVVRAAWGRFAQSQRPHELEVADGQTELARSEVARQWVVGFETNFRRPVLGPLAWSALRFEAYQRDTPAPRRRFENLLEPLNYFPEVEPDRVLLTPSRSRARGVELLLRGGRERVAWWLSYSHARSEDRFDGELGRGRNLLPRGLDQPNAVNLDVDLRLSDRWRLNAAFRYHTGWPITPVSFGPAADEDEDPVASFGALYSERLPSYHRLDLRLSRRAAVRHGTLTAFLDVQNLYDRQNVSGIDLQIEEGVVGLEHWPGIVPSVGFRWEF